MSQLAHDLRAPLARAQTLALLLQEARDEGERAEYLGLLLAALSDLDELLRGLEDPA